jgi:hypothetical protein
MSFRDRSGRQSSGDQSRRPVRRNATEPEVDRPAPSYGSTSPAGSTRGSERARRQIDREAAAADAYLDAQSPRPTSRSTRPSSPAERATGRSSPRSRQPYPEEPRESDFDLAAGSGEPYDDSYDDWDGDVGPEPTRTPRHSRRGIAERSRQQRASGRQRGAARPTVTLPQVTVPRFVSEAELVRDRVAMGIVGIALFSVALMAAILANRVDRLGSSLVIHIDAAGFPDRWAAPEILWRIPIMLLALTLIDLVLAWFVAPVDRFAARFILGATLVVHLIAWVAAIDLIW